MKHTAPMGERARAGSSIPPSGTFNVALVGPPDEGSAVERALERPGFVVLRCPLDEGLRPIITPDVVVLDLSTVSDRDDAAAIRLEGRAREIAQLSRAPIVMVAEPAVYPLESAMGDHVRGYLWPSDLGRNLGAVIKAVYARHCLDEQLRRTEAQLSNLLKETEHAFFAVSLDGFNLDTSQTELEMLGYKRDEIIGQPSAETRWLRPSEGEEILSRVRREGRLKNHVTLFKKKGGREPIWTQVSCHLERDANNRPTHITGFYRNVTAVHIQAQYRAALSAIAREAQRADDIPRFVCRTILHTTVARVALFLIHEPSQDVLVVQHVEGLEPEAARRVLGVSIPRAAIPLGNSACARFRQDGAFPLAALCDDPAASLLCCPVGDEAESRSFLAIIGRHTPVEGDGQMRRLEAFLGDVAHHLRMIVALQINRLQKASREAVHGPGGSRMRVDDFLSHLLRALRDEVPFEGGAFFRLVQVGPRLWLRLSAAAGAPPAKASGDIEVRGVALDGARAFAGPVEWWSRDKLGELYPAPKGLSMTVPIGAPGAKPMGLVHATGRAAVEGSLGAARFTPWDEEIFKVAAEQAELAIALLGAEEQRSYLLAQVTHEIRAPVNTIRAILDNLSKRPYEETRFTERRADLILEAEVLLDLAWKLDRLFGVPRARPGTSSPVAVEPIVRAIVRQMEPELRERGISPSQIEISLSTFPLVPMAQADLKQLFFNLFQNALRYARPAGAGAFRVRVVAAVNNKVPGVRFRDWGIGVPDVDRDRIFDSGIRGSNVHEVQVRGTGLGLAICRQIMSDYGGAITLTNLRQPTEFTLSFPTREVEKP